MAHKDHPCAICGKAPAPFGFRLPGLVADLPAAKRGYLWVCVDHREDARARQKAAVSAKGAA